jgi:hypothetical protein
MLLIKNKKCLHFGRLNKKSMCLVKIFLNVDSKSEKPTQKTEKNLGVVGWNERLFYVQHTAVNKRILKLRDIERTAKIIISD